MNRPSPHEQPKFAIAIAQLADRRDSAIPGKRLVLIF
jgi:hypothetical protein